MDVEALRARTPGTAHRTHLNNAGAGLMSQTTLDAVTEHLGLEARIGGYEAETAAQDLITAAHEGLAQLVNGRDDQIALFDNSTHAWNAAGYSVPLKAGDRIITARDEYGSAALAYFQIAKRTGAEIVVIPNEASGQVDVDALRAEVDERTKLIGLPWIPTSGGLINPAAEVGAIARDADTLFLLDATQAVGQLPIDVAALGCDFLTGTGRKFLRGPRGTGFLWVSDRALERVEPPVVEIQSAEWIGGREFRFAPGARRFASWETSCASVIGLGAAVRQALELGLDEIADRAIALGALLREALAEIPGVTTHDLGERKCAIVTAKVDGHDTEQVRARLAEEGINVTTTVAGHNPFDSEVRDVHPLVRFSPHYYNTEAELDRAVTAVARMAG